MEKDNNTLLRYMSERLKQEPYISNPNSKLFLAEVATVIMHDIKEDGNNNLIVDDRFNNFKDRIFDFSIKKIQATRNYNYFRDKDDTSLSDVFRQMLDDFKKKEILALVQLFDDVESIDDDYKIIFKKKTHNIDVGTPKLKNPEKPFAINQLTSEDEIRQYFKNKIDDGYYTDINKLLVDFTLMMYRRGAFSIDLSLPSFNSTIAYINKLIKKYLFYSLPANELESRFSYLWKTAKPIIINRAIDSLQIPYETNQGGSFILPQKNEVPKISEDNIATKEIKGDPVDNERNSNNKLAKFHIYPDNVVEQKLSELFDVSETDIIEEDALLNEINSLLYSHAWENAYDLFGDLQYIIYIQKKLVESKKQTLQYVVLKEFESKHKVFFTSHKKQLKLKTRQDARRSLRNIWFAEYTISTVIKIGKVFESIESIEKNGLIMLKDYEVPKPADIKYDDTLKAMYDISIEKIIPEDDIIRLHKNLVQIKRWTNVADCIASVSYIIINQPFYKDKGLGYPLLKSLIMKCAIIGEQDDLKFEEGNHGHNIEMVRETFLQRYGIKELTDNYISIFGRYNVAEDGTITLDEPNKEQSTNIENELEHIDKLEINSTEDNHQEQVSSTDNKNMGVLSNEDAANISADEIEEDEEDSDEEFGESEEEDVPEEEENVIDEEEYIDETIDDTPVTIILKCETRAEKELASFWNSTFKDGYYDTYIWKNRISTEVYNKIKDYLKTCITDPNREDGFAKRYAKVIVLYIAEWYKREYNGNDGRGNPIEAIGIKSLRTKKLWEWAELDNNLLYSNEYLESIYTLGGLPIKYIKHNDGLMQELSDIYNNTTPEDSTMDNIFRNNRAIQYSIKKQRGSLHLLLKTLNDTKDYPIHQTDREKSPFKQFLKLLKEWRPKTKKFSIDWIVEINDYTPIFRRKIRLSLKAEDNGAMNNCIPYYRLGEGFKDTNDFDLFLYFCNDDEDGDYGSLEGREHIRFTNNFNGHFIGENITDYYIFSDIPTYSFRMIKIIAQSKTNHIYVTLQKENVEPYLQLFKTWKYCTFSTRRNLEDTYILLPFDCQIHSGHEPNNSPKYLTKNGMKYRFIKINGQFSFTDLNGKEIFQYEQSNKIEVSTPIHNNLFIYQNERYFTRVKKGENGVEKRDQVLLIFNKSDIKITQYFDITDPIVIEEDVIIKFKKETETNYKIWANDNQPEQGFIKLQINVQDRKIQLNAYYIPSDIIPFKRDCTNKSIIIDNCVNVIGTNIKLKEETNNFKTYQGLNSIDRNGTYYSFKVGSADDYIIIPIIKPLNVTELYYDSLFIEEYKNDTDLMIRIPLQFKDKYSLRKYDWEGVTDLYHLSNDNVNLLNFELNDEENSLTQTYVSKNTIIPVEYYLCTDKKYIGSTSELRLQVGEKEADNYFFYFWDMDYEHEPYQIKCDYNNGSLDLHTKDYPNGIIFQSLKRGDVCPRHYCKPILTTHGKKWPNNYESIVGCAKCFEIASIHNIPYRMFEPLLWLIKDTDTRLVLFFAYMITTHWSEKNDNELFDSLVRLSKELYFAWPFLNIKVWRNYKSDCRKWKEHLGGEQFGPITDNYFIYKSIQKAKYLFIRYGELTNYSSISHLKEFVDIFWNSKDNNSPKFIEYNNHKWFTYDKIIDNNVNKKIKKWKSLPTKALCFMRARPLNNKVSYPSGNIYGKETIRPDIIGFCDHENYDRRHKIDNVRNIKSICEFLRLLYEDNDSYYKIISLFKFYGIIKGI